MQMTEVEIRRVYKSARNKKKQISILAELNGCSTGKILGIVHVGMPIQAETGAGAEPSTESEEKRNLMQRLDELDAMIKPLEDEYRRTAEMLKKIEGQEP